MYKKLKNFFTKNLHWKAFSVLISAVLWFIVMNINNPTEVKTFSLNITLLNKEKLYENKIDILNLEELEDKKAEIKIKATRPTLDELSKKANRDEIKLPVDLSQFELYTINDEPQLVTVNLKPSLPNLPYPNNNLEILSFSPMSANIILDSIITTPKKIHVKKIGQPKQGYISSNPEISSEYINITGPKSIVEQVQVIHAEIDISDQTETIERKVIPTAYDKYGNKITNISFNIPEVSVKVPINLKGKINIIEPILEGNLPDGYVIKNITYKPKSIEVIGNIENLKTLTEINIPKIDISNLTESAEFSFSITEILKQNNLTLKSPLSPNVKIFIDIEKTISKNIDISANKLIIVGYNDKFNINMDEFFSIDITGREELINNLDVNKISYSIDITNLEEGSHKVEIKANLSEGISFSKTPYININIIKKPSEEIPSTEETNIKEIIISTETTIEEFKEDSSS